MLNAWVYYGNEVLYFAKIEELNAKLAVKTKKTCQKCIKFKRQVKSKNFKLCYNNVN